MGLFIALYSVAIGISGSLLVFEPELTVRAYPQFSGSARPVETIPDQAIAVAQQSIPDGRPITITFPNPDSPHWMIYMLLGPESREVFVDATSGKLVGSRDPSATWIGMVRRIHVSLLLGSFGRKLSGYSAWILVGMCMSGLFLWWPSAGQWASRFYVQPGSGWRVLSWQLHHATGGLALPFVLVLAITGTYFIWPVEYITAISKVFARTVVPKPAAARGALMSIDMLAAKTRGTLPGLPIHRIQIVDRADQPVRVTLREGAVDEFHRVSTLFLHPVTGDVLLVDRLDSRPLGDKILGWFSAMHFGVFGGIVVRVVWTFAGLALPALAISGFLLWWRRVILRR